MPLIVAKNIHIAFGGPPLLDDIDLIVDKGERIALLGRNGTGKTTLMRIIAGVLQPDEGEVTLTPGLRVSMLTQDVTELDPKLTVRQIIDGRLREYGGHNSREGWSSVHVAEKFASQLGIDPSAAYGSMSGGMRRRVLLASALVMEPDILLLDEPTNHLDLAGIQWVEKLITSFNGALMFVSHDRALMKKLATRVVEVDRGKLFDWRCGYEVFLRRRQEFYEDEQKRWERLDKKLSEEEEWIRKGIKARRTRNEGRVRRLQQLRSESAGIRRRLEKGQLNIQEFEQSGRIVMKVHNLCHTYTDKPVIQGFSTIVSRGDRIGVAGPNGTGKTTLIKLLTKELTPTSGTVKHGTNLHIAYFDQHRRSLDPDKDALFNVGQGSEYINVNGVRRHIYAYLRDFLFTPERARTPVGVFSGGERSRLVLAKLFTQPSNVLVMDEPTNDLDLETLELLEELLVNYEGTVILVSHDRAFLDNVVTNMFVIRQDGTVGLYNGGYEDLVMTERTEKKPVRLPDNNPAVKQQERRTPKRGLSYKEKLEWESLPGRIEMLEAEFHELSTSMSSPDFYRNDSQSISKATSRAATLHSEIEAAYVRWQELELRAAGK
jgi:ATP-binding cassette subfamily F protein uup